ncbi:DUF2111 domain-containing protein [Methanolobus sp. ZRKC3]|uniref:DUF2111 domain-containing protein n=1 Tax=Methanolobus sp. ZRKC3 TaxID=3125786 RepID=UPI00325220C7
MTCINKCGNACNGTLCLNICADSSASDLEPVAQVVHTLLGIPITMRSRNCNGIRMERGVVLDRDYTGPLLEEAIKTSKIVRGVPTEGVYKGKSVIVTPIRTLEGNTIGAIGVVDIVAALDILSMFKEYPGIVDEVEESRKRLK